MNYDPTTNLSRYPGIEMARFGLNPHAEPLYRIVFAASRRHMVQGEWSDGSVGAKWRLLSEYKGIGNFWVLERWLSAEDYHKMSRQNWERMYPSLPYQSRGDYELCHVFEAAGPSDANLDKLIMWIEEGKKRDYQEHRQACAAQYEQEEKDTEREMQDRTRNALRAFGSAPMTGYSGGKGTKTWTPRIAPQPLPRGNNKFAVQTQGEL